MADPSHIGNERERGNSKFGILLELASQASVFIVTGPQRYFRKINYTI